MGTKASAARGIAKNIAEMDRRESKSNGNKRDVKPGLLRAIGRKTVSLFGDRAVGMIATTSVVAEKISDAGRTVGDKLLSTDSIIRRRRAVALGSLAALSLVAGTTGAILNRGGDKNPAETQPRLAHKPDISTQPSVYMDSPEGAWGESREALINFGNIDPALRDIQHYNGRLVAINGLPTGGPDRSMQPQWIVLPKPQPIEICPVPQNPTA